ncbi:MAG: DNA repair protein RecO C-terminal domain-containing protein [Muribaculum sp.]|nr:DNA repair protein RecO C-terminal domain-containing protein [Muribaculum sp.]
MKESLMGIVLTGIKHSDRHNVTNIYTRERGRMAFLTPAGATKRGRSAMSLLMPLSVVELQTNISASRDLHIPSSVSPSRIWHSIYINPLKSTIAMFLAEFLQRLLREAPQEPRLWDFIVDSIALFDATSHPIAIANFHITFLVSLMPLMGIQPDIDNFTDGMEFDMKAGTMVLPFSVQNMRGMRINATRSALLPILSRINYANSRCFRFKGTERSDLLENILKYYGCHFPGCDNLKSLEIMREIYN